MARHPYAPIIDGKKKVRLDKLDPADDAGLDKERALAQMEKLGSELTELTNLLAYAGQRSLLVVVQGRDASGKDGAIRKILEYSNVLNARVVAFKAPTSEELAHDFLWRVHKDAPAKGKLALFNRSHYEDVIAVRVHDLVPEKVWKDRYQHINHFEQLLVKNGTIVLKFCLHISRDEQVKRLLEREEDPRTAWKLNVNDWRELPLWDATTAAYEDAINRCASPELPWYLVPADRKWFRNLAILERLVLALRPHRDSWREHLKKTRSKMLPEIRQIRAQLGIGSDGQDVQK
jgi:PPK2 family polyphosphate:nucleotide phosphotransferase